MIGYEQDGQTMEAGPYDLVITALGRRSERVLADELREKHPEIECVCVGDADHPATALGGNSRLRPSLPFTGGGK